MLALSLPFPNFALASLLARSRLPAKYILVFFFSLFGIPPDASGCSLFHIYNKNLPLTIPRSGHVGHDISLYGVPMNYLGGCHNKKDRNVCPFYGSVEPFQMEEQGS